MTLPLHEVHAALGARFTEVNGHETVAHYGDPTAEHAALRSSAGILDLGARGRFCLTGTDRVRLLHGQVTNDIVALAPLRGCYAAFVSNKGRMQADAFVYALPNELLVDVEPGLTTTLLQRLDHYIVADDVQCVDVTPYYGLLSVQGPRAAAVLTRLNLGIELPEANLAVAHLTDPTLGELYVTRTARTGSQGFDLFIPLDVQAMVLDKLVAAAHEESGSLAGWEALELARLEAGIPRFGLDIDETNLAPEAGIESRAISYSKGCYIGQETIARIAHKHARQRAYAERHLVHFPNRRYQFWSPVVPKGRITTGLSGIDGLELVINGEYKQRICALRQLAGSTTHDARNPVFRVLQILEHLRD